MCNQKLSQIYESAKAGLAGGEAVSTHSIVIGGIPFRLSLRTVNAISHDIESFTKDNPAFTGAYVHARRQDERNGWSLEIKSEQAFCGTALRTAAEDIVTQKIGLYKPSADAPEFTKG